MGLPSKRRTKTSKRDRASHFALEKKALVKCPKCGKASLSHTACGFCGTYKGRQVIVIKVKEKTVKQKAQERKEATKAKESKKTEKKSSK